MEKISAYEAKRIADEYDFAVTDQMYDESMKEIYEKIRTAAKSHFHNTFYTLRGYTPYKKLFGMSIPFTSERISAETLWIVANRVVETLKQDDFKVKAFSIRKDRDTDIDVIRIEIGWYK